MSAEKREKIFKLYSSNLAMLVDNGFVPEVRKKYKNPYVCPICLDEFDESFLDVSKPQYLTLEDAPPKSLGGKSNVLTCKKCNNTCGTTIDSHLANRIKELDKMKFFQGSEARVKVENEGLRVNGTVIVTDGGVLQMKHNKENNNPEILEKFIKTVKKDVIINISFAMPTKVKDNRLKMALLKTGYLLMFEKYGYALLFDEQYDRLRKQILNPDQEIYPLDFWFMGPFPRELTQIVPFVKEKNLSSVFPFFELDSGKTKYIFGTVLPINNRPIEEIITAFRNRFNETSWFELEMFKFAPEIDFLGNPDKVKELIDFTKTLK